MQSMIIIRIALLYLSFTPNVRKCSGLCTITGRRLTRRERCKSMLTIFSSIFIFLPYIYISSRIITKQYLHQSIPEAILICLLLSLIHNFPLKLFLVSKRLLLFPLRVQMPSFFNCHIELPVELNVEHLSVDPGYLDRWKRLRWLVCGAQ